MFELFDEVFFEVMEEKNYEEWYELYDSEDFNEVERRLEAILGEDPWNFKEFRAWDHEMAMEL